MRNSLLILTLLVSQAISAQQSLLDQIFNLPGVTVTKTPAEDHFHESYLIRVTQPLDHEDPSKGTFEQKIMLKHAGFDRPTIIETEGYALRRPRTLELSKILQANQIQVEYRFFGESKPEVIPYEFLTNQQGAADHHRIVSLFKKIYDGKWLSTGISKGGESSLIFRTLYPQDVDVTVAYVAPVILDTEDNRTDEHIASVGSKKCRKKIDAFQRLALQRRDSMLIYTAEYAAKSNTKFSIGNNVALEYAVLEYPFSFWQWGGDCAQIPSKDASTKEIFEHLNGTASMWVYTDYGIEYLYPSFYQHLTQLGYYGYETKNVEDMLKDVKSPTNAFFAPENVELSYDPSLMKKVKNWTEAKGNNIIYIYGEYDTWSACAVNPSKETNAVKVVKEGGSHSTRIKDLAPDQQKQVYEALKSWIGTDVTPVN